MSIVLPVYNEADQIAACLWAIARQTVRPYEVIVVDNNSTDSTVAIAASFPFVRVVTESRQGVVHARSHGFDVARGSICARLDADTRVPEDWVARILDIFKDGTVAAVSGAMQYHDLPARQLVARIDLAFRGHIARKLGNEVFLQAANMAIRRSAWRQVRSQLCYKKGLHEDFDLAIHLQQNGHKVLFCPDLQASISARCLDDSVRSFYDYAMLNPGTYALHGLSSKRHLYPLVGMVIVLQLPLRTLYRMNQNYGQGGWSRLFQPSATRVNPATFVD